MLQVDGDFDFRNIEELDMKKFDVETKDLTKPSEIKI